MRRPSSEEWFDLTLPVRPGMPVYPGDPPVAFLRHCAHETNGFEVTAVRLGTHAGTHVDAPSHFLPSGGAVDRLAIAALVGPARVIDLSSLGPGGEIDAERLGAIAEGERLLLRTDWSRRFGEADYYSGSPRCRTARSGSSP